MVKNSKILVAGGTGFIGSNLILELISQGNEIISLSNFPNKKKRIKKVVYTSHDLTKPFEEKEVKFVVTDFKNEINVIYSGLIPNLFAEGKGVVAEGFLKDKSLFLATKILAKHDENYMPPEVKAALEEQ